MSTRAAQRPSAASRVPWLPLVLLGCGLLALAGGLSHRHALSVAAAALLLLAWLPSVWRRRSVTAIAVWVLLAALLLVPALAGRPLLALMALPVVFLAAIGWLFARTLRSGGTAGHALRAADRRRGAREPAGRAQLHARRHLVLGLPARRDGVAVAADRVVCGARRMAGDVRRHRPVRTARVIARVVSASGLLGRVARRVRGRVRVPALAPSAHSASARSAVRGTDRAALAGAGARGRRRGMNDSLQTTLRIDPAHPALAGHFPGNPIVPGVVVLERVAAALRAWRGERVEKLDAKFVQPLRPGEAAVIALDGDGARVRFEVTGSEGAVFARGTLLAADRRA